jgi:hypothetical protein
VTSGDDLLSLAEFAMRHPGYCAADVISYLCD